MKYITTIALILLTFTAHAGGKPAFAQLYYDGGIVGTVVPPASSPMEGRDAIYPIMGGVEGQIPVAGVAPGHPDYHGGQWAVHVVTWMVEAEPYLLTSEADIMTAYYDGDLPITRVMEADFKCPIQRKPKS